jgi:hypothetical protein
MTLLRNEISHTIPPNADQYSAAPRRLYRRLLFDRTAGASPHKARVTTAINQIHMIDRLTRLRGVFVI